MKVIDFCQDFDQTLWNDVLEKIRISNDPLKKNYLNLTPGDFVCLPVLIENKKIICFSGLQINESKWGKEIGRINARMWIEPSHRHLSLGKMKNSDKFFNTKYLLPLQIQKAKEIGLDTLFISREGSYRNFMEKYCDLIFSNTGHRFKLLDRCYNVCGDIPIIPESCKQLIAWFSFSNNYEIWDRHMGKHQL
jgi:hypothetical protein